MHTDKNQQYVWAEYLITSVQMRTLRPDIMHMRQNKQDKIYKKNVSFFFERVT